MKLFALKAVPNVHIFTTNTLIGDEWSAALRTAGLSISCSSRPTLPLLSNNLILLLEPNVSLLRMVKDLLCENEGAAEKIYIISDENEWHELSLQFSIHLLGKHTHPLEAARIFNHTKKAVIRNYFARYATFFNF